MVLKATIDSAAESRADDLRNALGVLEAMLSDGDPHLLADWQQNTTATDEQIARVATEFFGGKQIPPELEVWFRCNLGSVHNPVEIEPEPLFHPLDVDWA